MMNTPYASALVLMLIHGGATLAQDSFSAHLSAADRLFANGSIEAARRKYEELIRTTPGSPEIMERLGYVCHLTGQYREAVEWLVNAGDRNSQRRIRLLAYSAYSLYLMEDYSRALRTLKEVESTDYQYQTAFFSEEQLRQLTETPPHQFEAGVTRTVVAMEMIDPLPVIRVRIGSRTVHAFIDTGGPQFVIDPALAQEEHLRPLSEQVSRGIGGSAEQMVRFAVVGKVALGDIELRNVPVMLLPVRGLSKLFGVQIDAVLGTGTLSQFLPTLDFPGKRLVLRTRSEANREEVRRMEAKARLPFLLDDIHSMYAQCCINHNEPVLLYFDTGLVDDQGAAILTAKERLIDLGIPVPDGSKSGYVDITSVRIGSLERRNVRTLYGSGAQLTYCEYIRPYGLIGHNFLKHYKWTIDFDSRTFLFD